MGELDFAHLRVCPPPPASASNAFQGRGGLPPMFTHPVLVTFSTVGATREPSEPIGTPFGGESASVWLSWYVHQVTRMQGGGTQCPCWAHGTSWSWSPWSLITLA